MERTYSCIIVDDEPLAQSLLEKFINRLPFLKLVQKCNHAIDAIDAIHRHRPDIVFLDITMPEMTGLELLQTFTSNRPQVIMTTAYPEYAVEGFNYDVTDYLLKPISFERLLRAVNKVKDRLSGTPTPAEPEPAPTADAHFFWIKEGKKLMQINAEDVVYIEGMKDYVKIFLADRMIMTYLTMTKMEELLPAGLFLRVNRSYIVRKKAIKAITGNTIETTSNQEVPIGIRYRDLVRDALREKFIGRVTLD